MSFSFLFQFWVVAIAGRINEYQHTIIAYKDEEIRCLREQLKKATAKERIRFTDKQRIRLAAKAKKLGRATLRKINPLVTPDTLLRWHKELIAQKYDSSRSRTLQNSAEAIFYNLHDGFQLLVSVLGGGDLARMLNCWSCRA